MQADHAAPWHRDPTGLRPGNFLFAVFTVALATLAGHAWFSSMGYRNLSLILVIGVLAAGYRCGVWPAIVAAVLAFLALNFFFEDPQYTLSINAQDVLPFVTFLVLGLMVGGLTGRLSDRARQVKSALADMTLLFDAGRDLSMAVHPADAVARLQAHLEKNDACVAAVWLVEGGVPVLGAASESAPPGDVEALSAAFRSEMPHDEITPKRAVLRMHTGGRTVGIVATWCGRGAVLPDSQWLRALVDLAAVAIDRARLIAEIAETRVVAEKEGLRTALLSSLSHDLRTPIATVLASATSLLEYGAKFDAATRRELLETIRDESERLNRYVGNLLEMTRLESGALQVGRALIDPKEAMAAALRRMERRLENHDVVRQFDAGQMHVDVDPVLVEQALMNVIENAVEHAPARSTIKARVTAGNERVRMSIEDEGSGIAAGDLEHVFEKFFRGGGDRRRASGVGLGLSVTRGLIESFGGTARAVSPVRDGRGTRIELDLPAHRVVSPDE